MDALDATVLEVWIPIAAPTVCAGCVYLGSVGPMAADVGPRPPLHAHCRCRRERLDLRRLQPWDKIKLALWAARNRDQERAITKRAHELVAATSG